MELFNILNEIEELIENSPRIPMTRRVLVDEDKILDYLDRIRTSLPEEMRQARWVMQEREKVIAESKQEAMRILEDAKKKMEIQAEETEIVKKAREIAEEIKRKAEEEAEKIRRKAEEEAKIIRHGALEYTDEKLEQIEAGLSKLLREIQESGNRLNGLLQEVSENRAQIRT